MWPIIQNMIKGLARRSNYSYRLQINQKPKRTEQDKPMQLSPEQQAELHLIQISNHEIPTPIIQNKQEESYRKFQSSAPIDNFQSRRVSIRLRKTPKAPHLSVEKEQSQKLQKFRMSVTERLTESFKSGMKPSFSQIRESKPFPLRQKLPLSISHYLLLDSRTENQKKKQDEEPRKYFLRSSVPTRKFSKQKNHDNISKSSNFDEKRLNKKLMPIEQSYWKIYNGRKQP